VSSHHDATLPTRDELTSLIQVPGPQKLKSIALIVGLLGIAVWVIGVVMGVQRAWLAWHVNWLFFTVVASAGVMLAAVQRITTARWSRPVVRMIEAFVAWLPIGFVMLLITVLIGKGSIFPWTHEHLTVPEKAQWLDPTFWTLRTIIVYALITLLSLWFVYSSVRLDVALLPEWGANWAKGLRDRMRRGFGEERREIHDTHSLQGRLAVCLGLAFGFGWVILSWDLSMSMMPYFYSTMYGWQYFMGGWVVSIMFWALIARLWKNHLGADHVITANHFHDIGKLCFAFTAFWGYITFSQLLVIWYGNMGEETHFFRLRFLAPWLPLALAVGILAFGAPFFGLLGKFPKLFTPTMTLFALCSAVGIWLHRYLEIYPPVFTNTVTAAPFGLWEIAIFFGFLGLWVWVYLVFMDAFPRMRVTLMTSPYRDQVQVPYDPKTLETLPAHE
jgi:hypothetical protein